MFSDLTLDSSSETASETALEAAKPRPVYMGELPEFYVGEPGDTLWGISYFFNIEMEMLAELNHLSEYVGNVEGYWPPLVIEKPQYGLHIDFYNIAGKWETVHQSEALPWGVFDLTLFSGLVY